ncbi:FAD-binding oxidoreductase [Fuscibacter oryzae]|uniref:FAD-binding oxidoreductase n=1 Tax=Fuscibacter oryzae TaxID=2803939 RepID=A0A8J7SVG2_9RHOB|nr:FAD-binding oxidoreductase [Fuscibacter oryzae]MBL4929492.1 FAD-binding oxidoreductase [Fuscibacter oryzae]
MSLDEVTGVVLRPGDADYDAVRLVWNGMIDRRPAVIVRCRTSGDVRAAVLHARREGLAIAIRSGGHNVAGYAVCEGGVMIDLSLMNSVRVHPGLEKATVSGGATWADVDAATTPFARATPGGLISATGVAGLTLSGGIGWLRGTHGLACDNLLAADVVTAEGDLIRASQTENSDLLWALRGGGGNFGVVTAMDFALHPISPEIFFNAPLYPEEIAAEILPRWRDFMQAAPDTLSGLAEFSTIPEDPSYPRETWGRRVVALATVFDGPADEGERVTLPLRQLAEPLLDFSGRMSYRVLQTLYDGLFPKGRDRCYWKSTYLKGLDDEVICDVLAGLSRRPSEMTFSSIWWLGGAVSRVAPEATAFGDRSMRWMLSLDAIWSAAKDDTTNMGWVRGLWQELQRHSTGRLYLNFPGLGEGDSLVRNAFGPDTYARLQGVKRRYDPGNVFHLNQNIQP